MTIEKYFMINLHDRMLPTQWGLNPQPPDHQSDAHPTEPQWPANRIIGHYVMYQWKANVYAGNELEPVLLWGFFLC